MKLLYETFKTNNLLYFPTGRVLAKFQVVISLIVILFIPYAAISEEIPCDNPSICSSKDEDHVKFSLVNAERVLMGSFSFDGANFENDNSVIEVQFTEENQIGLSPVTLTVKLEIKEYFPAFTKNLPKADDIYKKLSSLSVNSDIQSIQTLESEIVNGLQEGGHASVDAITLRISIGEGLDDSRVRDETIPIFEGYKYALFLFRSIDSQRTRLFPWDFNIYPANSIQISEG